jgi:hypothetical protein
MKIAVFGCSWSAGVPTLTDQDGKILNWPYFLAKKTGWTVKMGLLLTFLREVA